MVESLDVFVVVEKDELIWMGSASTNDDALRLVRNYSRNAPGYFVVYSQQTEHRSFYIAGGDDPLALAKPELNFRSAC